MTEMPSTQPLQTYRRGDDTRLLRHAFGSFATGVTIVTSVAPDGSPIGLTNNSFTSVSLDPPQLLVCPARSGTNAVALAEAEYFAVSVLGDDAREISALFAGRSGDRFAMPGWETTERGVPVLSHALVTFECRRHAVHEGGDHLILVGEIEQARFLSDEAPLLYFRGRYHRIDLGGQELEDDTQP